ncbi:Exonuclease V [Cynara cardunculus var. scolymus]|uniref:Exonuclease V n=1 Tax=Cynara cardunculus var. scolymus TaxID=59895 RepID=A0A118K4R5_CYNCS|nr:Exonuclease V [Cynara cardunculus var. scolymus]
MAMEVEFEPPHEMIQSPTPPTLIEIAQTTSLSSSPPSQIPTEIVSDEEMSLIESAFSLAFKARPSLSSSSTSVHFHRNSSSITLHSKRSFSNYSSSYCVGDIEDGIGIRSAQKKRVGESLLYRFRRKTGLFVTDITSTQKEFFLVCGKPKATKAMKAGSARHAVLEEEVITRVEVVIRSAEEHWALKMINFIHGTNQLLMDGLTRELPLCAPTLTLNDVLRRYEYVCSMLPKTRDQLLLRYEYQKDQSLISENQFLYKSNWVTDQIRSSLEFWKGDREASYTPQDERWKCNHCKYASRCPVQNPVSEEA